MTLTETDANLPGECIAIPNLAWKIPRATFIVAKEDTLCQTPKL